MLPLSKENQTAVPSFKLKPQYFSVCGGSSLKRKTKPKILSVRAQLMAERTLIHLNKVSCKTCFEALETPVSDHRTFCSLRVCTLEPHPAASLGF